MVDRGRTGELSPEIAWNGNEDLREYTWSNLPSVFWLRLLRERYLTGIASLKLSPAPRRLLPPPPSPRPPSPSHPQDQAERLLANRPGVSIPLLPLLCEKFDTVSRFSEKWLNFEVDRARNVSNQDHYTIWGWIDCDLGGWEGQGLSAAWSCNWVSNPLPVVCEKNYVRYGISSRGTTQFERLGDT